MLIFLYTSIFLIIKIFNFYKNLDFDFVDNNYKFIKNYSLYRYKEFF